MRISSGIECHYLWSANRATERSSVAVPGVSRKPIVYLASHRARQTVRCSKARSSRCSSNIHHKHSRSTTRNRAGGKSPHIPHHMFKIRLHSLFCVAGGIVNHRQPCAVSKAGEAGKAKYMATQSPLLLFCIQEKWEEGNSRISRLLIVPEDEILDVENCFFGLGMVFAEDVALGDAIAAAILQA